jgi:hypothetical protein
MDQFYMMTNKNIIRALLACLHFLILISCFILTQKVVFARNFKIFYNSLQNGANEMTYLAALSVKQKAENVKR